MENQTENVSEAIQEQAPVQATDTQMTETVETTQPQETSSQSDKEYNFNQLRKIKEQVEEENRELRKVIETTTQAVPAPAPQADTYIGDDDLVEGKHLNKVYQEFLTLRNEIIPERLRSKFSDFDEVVTEENIKKLKQSEPELHASITSGNDIYRNAVSAYKTLKGLGIATENFSSQKEQVQSNHNRPLSAQAIKGQGALSEKNVFAGGLTPELKEQLQKEMEEAIRSH